MGKKEYLYQVNIDRLEFTYTTTNDVKEYLSSEDNTYSFQNGCIWLKRDEPRYYKNEFVIWCKDWNEEKQDFKRILGYLRFGSYNPNRQNVYITYENEALYESWMINARFFIEETLQLEFMQVSKLDIAIDFNFNIEKYLIRKYKDTEFELIVNGVKADDKAVHGVGFLSWYNPRHRLFANPQMVAKDNESTLTMKTYNKAKEIEQENGKFYIQQKAGFATTMYRIEITCKNHKKLAKTLSALGMSDLDLYTHLDDEDTLIKIFKHLMDRIIRLRAKRKSYNLLDLAIKDL